jgi:hypothetical protein
MHVEFHCPKCLKRDSAEVEASTSMLACRHCGWNRPLGDGDLHIGAPTRCLACGCDDLWRQKDFPPQLGVAIVALGILLSTMATAWMRPTLALGILMAFGLADLLLFLVMPDALVCYRCHARFRHVPTTDNHPKFDLELNERYRQEALRLSQAEAVERSSSKA